MNTIKNIDEIALGYLKAYFGLKNLIREKAKGDWSKLALLIENDENARQLDEQMSYYENQFREDTTLGNLFTSSKGVIKAISDFLREEQKSENAAKTSIAWNLEAARDMIADLTEDGEEDHRVVALDSLARLPNYNPDHWIRRKYMIAGIYLAEESKIPAHLVRRIEEACDSFIYGNFLACGALARATIETALKEKYPVFFQGGEPTLNGFLKQWHKIKVLKEHMYIKKQADFVRIVANQIMHETDDKTIYLIKEPIAKEVIKSMKQIIEFLYR